MLLAMQAMRRCPWLRLLAVALVLTMMMSGQLALAASDKVTAVSARLAADGRSFTVSAPGFDGFQAGWSATIERDGGAPRVLASAEGVVTPGPVTTIRFPNEDIELLFQLETRADASAVLARAGIRNTGSTPVNFLSAVPVDAKWNLPEMLDGWLVTGLHPITPVVNALRDVRQSAGLAEVFEYGGCYKGGEVGFLFGPMGEPVAYVRAHFQGAEGRKVGFRLAADMSGVQVDPGETRWSQQVMLLFEPSRSALPRWAGWVGKSHQARVTRPPLTGWTSWGRFGQQVTGKDVLDLAATVRRNPGRLRPDAIVLDRGHQSRENFPLGLNSYADAIAAAGARSGLMLEWNETSDPLEAVGNAVRAGFRYLKLSGITPWQESQNPKLTSFEGMRRQYAAIREAAGPDTYLLNANPMPDRASVGFMDASRVGDDATRDGLRDTIEQVLRSYPLNGRWFVLDPDVYFLGTDIAKASEMAGGWPMVRTWMSLVGMSCGSAFTSDPLNWEGFKPHWRNFEVMTPPAKERTEVLDLCADWHWPRLVGHLRREWGEATVALLWNPGNKERTVDLNFARAGMDSRRRYAVWSYWDNRYLGLAQEFWTTPPLAPSASQHLRFTPVSGSSVPVLIGSSLHIYCGAAEIKQVRSSRTAMTIELTDAGARAGDLFIYSRFQPIVRSVSGFELSAIDAAGENVWRIRLRGRQPGGTQRIEMAILLPVTRQWWFWSMIALVVGSLLIAVWRYVAWLQLQRRHTLSEERARIARDLHDDLGANLSEIAMISELAQDELPPNDPSRPPLNEIFTRAEENVRRLGEIVWAVNPANDTLERFAGFLCKFAQDYLSLAGVRCRLDLPETLPAIPLNSLQRHNLFLAAKEAIHNAVRHGAPSEVTLRIAVRDQQIVVTVQDNGCGFETAAVAPRGLANLRKRLEQLGGTFTCESQPGHGATVVLTAPFNSPKLPS